MQPGTPTVLVVCYGNLCRSPMAEGLLRARLHPDWIVDSAGTHAIAGVPPPEIACAVMLEQYDIDISGLRSAPLTVPALRAAAEILTMSLQQARLAAALAPEAADRIRLLGGFAPSFADVGQGDPGGPPVGPHEIPDPMGQTDDTYRVVAARLAQAADRFAAWLRGGAQRSAAPPPVSVPGWPYTTVT